MKKQITYISHTKTAKVLTFFYLILSIPFLLLVQGLSLASWAIDKLPIWTMLTLTIINALTLFFLLFVFCYIYNAIAKKFGGIEFNVRGESHIDFSVFELPHVNDTFRSYGLLSNLIQNQKHFPTALKL